MPSDVIDRCVGVMSDWTSHRGTHGQGNEDDHKCSLWYSGHITRGIAGQEEQCGQADVLQIEAYKDMCDGLWKEQTTSISRGWLVNLDARWDQPIRKDVVLRRYLQPR
jgi:hypothetical protein